MENENQQVLSSWKEIAAYLRVSTRTAQLWESERSLPVRRPPGRRGVVWADPAELDAWRKGADSSALDGSGEQDESGMPDRSQPGSRTGLVGDWTAKAGKFDEPQAQTPDSASVVPYPSHTASIDSPRSAPRNQKRSWTSEWVGVGACSLLFILFVYSSRSIQDRPLPRVTPLTADPGIEILPDLSPDGTLVAYCASHIAEGDTQLTVTSLDGGVRRLLGTIAQGGHPRWSPDGRWIAAMRRNPDNPDTAELAVFSPFGDASRRVTTMAGYQRMRSLGNFLALAWKPDGSTIAMSDVTAPKEPLSLYEVAVASGFRRRLTVPPASMAGDNQPVYSPDGRWLAFVRQVTYSEGDIYLLPAEGGNPQRLTSLNSAIDGLSWLPDSSGLILATDRGSGNQSLWRITLANPDRLEHVTGGEGNTTYPSSIRVDPDGAANLVYQFHLRDVNVWQYDIDDGLGNAKPLTNSTSLDYNPQYSPDGSQVAFVSKRSGAMEIWVCGSDGSNARQLTSRRQGFTDSPRWSPDGEWIAFTSNEGSNRDIYVVPRSGGSERRVTDNPSEEGRPSWSVDGRWIYFRSNRSGEPQIWKVRWEGGNPIPVTKGGGYEGFESPDGKTLYYVRSRQWTGLWEVPVTGGPERLVLDDVYQTGWAVTRDAIYYRGHPSKELRRWDLGSGKISVIGELGAGLGLHGSALTVRLDGGAVAFSQKDSDRLDLFTLTVPDWRRSWR